MISFGKNSLTILLIHEGSFYMHIPLLNIFRNSCLLNVHISGSLNCL